MQHWLTTHRSKLVVTGSAALVFGLAVALELAAILAKNGGKLVYTLDDAYIHLALAENIARGNYGVNLGEVSAAASSILWPFLLAPFAAPPLGEIVPLVFSVLAGFATVVIYARICALTFADLDLPRKDLVTAAVTILLIPATNLVALVFTGMEHSLQVLLAAVAMLGLITEARTGYARWWLWAALVLGPLVRYENLAISLPALLYLALRRHVKPALLAGGLLAVAMGAFSFFLTSHGLRPIPNSLIAKSHIVQLGSVWAVFVYTLYQNLLDRQGILLALWMFLLLAFPLIGHKKEERLLAACVALGIAGHLLMGSVGTQRRYQAYIWTAALLVLLYLYRTVFGAFFRQLKPALALVILTGFVLVTARPYLITTAIVPLAANNIYSQQYQMHRFVTEYYRAPVAVNDLGYVSYANDNHVLDLWGLASIDALEARTNERVPAWMDELARRYNVKLVMIYDQWFANSVPSQWVPVGKLLTGGLKVSVADRTVSFYATDPAEVARLRRLLDQFRRTLPPNAAICLRGRMGGA